MKFLPDIVDTVMSLGMFNTLVKAVIAAELVAKSKVQIHFTVFAPINDAFAQIPKKDFEMFLKNTAKLKEVSTFHVVEGKFMAAYLVQQEYLQTVSGGNLGLMRKVGIA